MKSIAILIALTVIAAAQPDSLTVQYDTTYVCTEDIILPLDMTFSQDTTYARKRWEALIDWYIKHGKIKVVVVEKNDAEGEG